jgi:hypothetical protein
MKTLSDLIDEGIHVRREAVRVIVTPACVARALEFNIGNRYLRLANIEYLAHVIRIGEWQDDHSQGIAFSDTSRLIDGQHRLLAIQKAGKPVIVRVDTGCNERLKHHIDIGVARNISDRTDFSDNKDLNRRLTEIIRAYCTVKLNSAVKMPISFLESAYSLWEMECNVVALYCLANKGKIAAKGLLRAGISAAYMEAVRWDKDAAISFMNSVTLPDGELQPGRALREWIIRSARTGGRSATILDYRAVWAAFEAVLNNRDVKVLRPLSRDMKTIGYPLKGGAE